MLKLIPTIFDDLISRISKLFALIIGLRQVLR